MRELSDILLDWYDLHARVMPWRVGPADRAAGQQPDPYAVWMSEIMLQQTKVASVRDYFRKFQMLWPNIFDLASAADADVMAAWAGLGYYARARNLLKCARTLADDHDGVFPDSYEALLKLPGIGPYTAAAIASIAFDRPVTVLDGNVERVMARMYDEHLPLPAAKLVLMTRADGLTPKKRSGDYAQAVMDLGATICTPRSPACGICPWHDHCQAKFAGTANELPKKTPKKPTPIRFGIAYVVQRSDGAVLLETRPKSGLLGGMLGFPSTNWTDKPSPNEPIATDWNETGLEARHTFTHFHLRLSVVTAQVDTTAVPIRGQFVSKADFEPTALPTAMRKVWELVVATRHHD